VRLSECEFIVSADATFILQQGLFIATNYVDPASGTIGTPITGCDRSEFVELM
jgi:hypothetical protein